MHPDPASAFLQTGLPPAASPPRADLPSLRKRGAAWLAWLVIIGVAAFLVVRQARRREAADGLAGVVSLQAQGRYLVGAASIGLPGKMLYDELRATLDRGSYSQRLRFAVLAGELVGPAEALDRLRDLEAERSAHTIEARPASVEAAGRLETLYRGYEKGGVRPDLPAEQCAWLRSRLGWFGELALAPAGSDPAARQAVLGPARRTVVAYLSMVALLLLGLAVGGFLLLLFGLLALLGRLRGGLAAGAGFGGVYAETFALYLAVFVGLSYLARLLSIPDDWELAAGGGIMLLSLVVLFWPRLRGASWRQVRADLGLHLGEQPLAEVLCGPAAYLAALPLLFAGVGVMFGLMVLQKRLGHGDPFDPNQAPSHPIVGVALQHNPWVWLQVFLVACVAAPVVEETMFRGVLYRHLREATPHWGRAASILLSVALSSFVFAAIHPQGLLGVPVLMALACAFAVVREWRGSLLPGVIAHGLNNFLVTLLLLLTAG
jgi:membrane protease YdiL (CAAX protease family)